MTYRSPAIAQWVSLVSFSAVKTQDEGRGTFLSEFPSGPGVFIHVGRSSLVWILRRRSGSFNLALESENHFCRCRRGRAAAALSLFPSFLWRSRDYLEISRISSLSPSLPRSIVSRSPRVCVSPPARRCRLWRSLTQGIRTAFSGISYA